MGFERHRCLPTFLLIPPMSGHMGLLFGMRWRVQAIAVGPALLSWRILKESGINLLLFSFLFLLPPPWPPQNLDYNHTWANGGRLNWLRWFAWFYRGADDKLVEDRTSKELLGKTTIYSLIQDSSKIQWIRLSFTMRNCRLWRNCPRSAIDRGVGSR